MVVCLKECILTINHKIAIFTTLWGDGGIHHGVSHVYTTAGTFDVTLIISDIHYCYDTMVIENMLTIHEVVADFGVTNLSGCDSVLVEFENLSTPNSLVAWDFGDGGHSISPKSSTYLS